MIHSPEILKVLEAAPLFRGISNKLLAKNLSQSKLRTLNSGEILLVAGQVNNLVYISSVRLTYEFMRRSQALARAAERFILVPI